MYFKGTNYLPPTVAGSSVKLILLQRRFSPLPSIHTYVTLNVPFSDGSSKYLDNKDFLSDIGWFVLVIMALGVNMSLRTNKEYLNSPTPSSLVLTNQNKTKWMIATLNCFELMIGYAIAQSNTR